MPSLMRLADGAAALAKRGTPVVAAKVPSAVVVPIKLRRERADDGYLMGSEYCDAPVQCRALGQATGFALRSEHPGATELAAVKINDIKNFLRNNISGITLEESQTLTEPSEVALMDHARQCTAMGVVSRN